MPLFFYVNSNHYIGLQYEIFTIVNIFISA